MTIVSNLSFSDAIAYVNLVEAADGNATLRYANVDANLLTTGPSATSFDIVFSAPYPVVNGEILATRVEIDTAETFPLALRVHHLDEFANLVDTDFDVLQSEIEIEYDELITQVANPLYDDQDPSSEEFFDVVTQTEKWFWSASNVAIPLVFAEVDTDTTFTPLELAGFDEDAANAGPAGPAGTNGTDGVNGTDGATGPAGTDGTNGIDGTAGTDGVDGTNGTNGVDGTDGVDASQEFSIYEALSDSAQVLTGTPVAVNLTFERFTNTDFSIAPGIITVNRAGLYAVEYGMSFDDTDNARSGALAEIYWNGAAYASSRAYTYDRNLISGESTANKKVLMQLSIGDTIEVRVNIQSGSGISTIDFQSNIIFDRRSS